MLCRVIHKGTSHSSRKIERGGGGKVAMGGGRGQWGLTFTGYPQIIHRMTPELLLILSLVSALVGVGGAVFSALFARRSVDPQLQGDVNELAAFVERIAKEQRRDRMREVRRGEKASPEGGSVPEGTVSSPFGPLPPGAPVADRKAALRARLKGVQ